MRVSNFVRAVPAFIRAASVVGLALVSASARGQCTQPAANCQSYSTAAAARSSTTSDSVAGGSISADNITFAAAGTFGSLCFWGRYDGTPPSAASETFQLVVYADLSGVPGAPIVGPLTLGGASPSPGTTLTRGPALPASAGASAFVWSATFPGVAVNAGQCVWVQINGVSASLANKWNWLTTNVAVPTGDSVFLRRVGTAGTFTIDDRENGFDLALCADVSLAQSACTVPTATNASCAGAQTLSTFPSSVSGDTNAGLLQQTPFCKNVLIGGRALWYSFAGDGTTVTLSTCDAATNFDTAIAVYCGTCASGNNAGLNCVASNDDASSACSGSMASGRASSLSIPTRAGTQYLVAVTGFAGQTGAFVLRAASDGVVVPPAQQPACASDRCVLDTTGSSVGDSESCGAASLNGECDDPGVVSIALNTTYRGTISATGTRDIDFYTIPGVPVAGASYDITVMSEFPAVVVAYAGACTASGANPGAIVGASISSPCSASASPTLQIDIPPGSLGGAARVLITAPDFNGLPCGASNTYTVRVSPSLVGACCVLGQSCVAVAQTTCANLGGGAWYGPGTVCTPPSGGGDACETVACCNAATGACTTNTAAQCSSLGLMPGASFSVCSPNPCPQPAGRCCRGATCATNVAATACTGANTQFAPAQTNCNLPGNNLAPCCFADFNKQSGITVQDIFDFLAAWFIGDPIANLTNNGAGVPTVQSVFDFLTAWFTGGC